MGFNSGFKGLIKSEVSMVPKLTTMHEIKTCKKLQTAQSASRTTDH